MAEAPYIDYKLGQVPRGDIRYRPMPHYADPKESIILPSRGRPYNNDTRRDQNNYTAPKAKQLMSFQNYVKSLSEPIDEHTACKKYKDFMANLSQSKVGRFFDANKDREWFRVRYHPIESQETLHRQNMNFMKRLNIFSDLHQRRYFDTLPYTSANTSAIINLLDAIIVQLEDGPKELVDQLLSRDAETEINEELRSKFVPDKATSVTIDDINIETTVAEIQELCKSAHPDLVRIAQLDPYYIEEGHLRRKVIAIYASHVDIKEVCWKLGRMKFNNRSVSVYINKCLTNRVVPVDAVSNHHISIVNDIRNAIILILNFDELKGLYGKRRQLLEAAKQELNKPENMEVKMEECVQDEEQGDSNIDNVAPLSPPRSVKSGNEEETKPFDVTTLDEDKEKEKKKLFEFKFNTELSSHRQVTRLNKSKNLILEGAYTYLVDFINSAQAKYFLTLVPNELLGDSSKEDLSLSESDKPTIIENIVQNLSKSVEESTKFLDNLLWYLRIVHSFDYYSRGLYRQEDELSLRLGVIHVREHSTDVMMETDDECAVRAYISKVDQEYEEFGQSQVQRYVTKDEERFNYKSYGKVITDELTSYAQRIQKPKSTDTEEVYKCRHCTRVFQKLADIGRHFVSKHRWAIDIIERDTDFFNAYLFDSTKINPCPPEELLEVPPNRFAKITSNFSEMGEDPDLLQQTLEAYSKMDSFVREPAPRAQVDNDPRNDSIVDYTDISFDDAI